MYAVVGVWETSGDVPLLEHVPPSTPDLGSHQGMDPCAVDWNQLSWGRNNASWGTSYWRGAPEEGDLLVQPRREKWQGREIKETV